MEMFFRNTHNSPLNELRSTDDAPSILSTAGFLFHFLFVTKHLQDIEVYLDGKKIKEQHSFQKLDIFPGYYPSPAS